MTTPYVSPADWYPDPSGGAYLRYWDGIAWSSHTRPFAAAPVAHAAVTPYVAAGAPAMVTYPAVAGFAAPTGVWRGPVDSRPRVLNLWDAIRVCTQKYAQFDGRASRPEYWYAQLAYLLAIVAALFVAWIPIIGWLVVLFLWLFALASFLPLLAVTVRRLRDAGLHWAWIFISFVPFGGIALIVLLAQPSKHP